MATIALYSVKQGKTVDWDLSVDASGEIVATHAEEFLKFPAGLTKDQLNEAFSAHNAANEGVVALKEDEIDAASKAMLESQKLLDSL